MSNVEVYIFNYQWLIFTNFDSVVHGCFKSAVAWDFYWCLYISRHERCVLNHCKILSSPWIHFHLSCNFEWKTRREESLGTNNPDLIFSDLYDFHFSLQRFRSNKSDPNATACPKSWHARSRQVKSPCNMFMFREICPQPTMFSQINLLNTEESEQSMKFLFSRLKAACNNNCLCRPDCNIYSLMSPHISRDWGSIQNKLTSFLTAMEHVNVCFWRRGRQEFLSAPSLRS